jgi:hypothetical protein
MERVPQGTSGKHQHTLRFHDSYISLCYGKQPTIQMERTKNQGNFEEAPMQEETQLRETGKNRNIKLT